MNAIIIFCAQYLYLFVILGLVIAWFRVNNKTKAQFIAATIVAGIIAFILSRIGGHVYYDPRPFVAEHVKPLIPHVADNGFPSDHALLTMTLTAITYFFRKRIAAIMLVLTVAIGVARVLARVHSPLDIIGGWVFGVVGAIAGYYLVRWLFHAYVMKHEARKTPTATSVRSRGTWPMRKVPEITIYFWIIKLLSTALGESTSDYLVHHFDPYLVVITGFVAFVVVLALQFKTRRYIPWVYWLAVVMVAIFGTMVADVIHIVLGIPYVISTIAFALALAVIFVLWGKTEKTLSIHSIYTTRREVFYWATVQLPSH